MSRPRSGGIDLNTAVALLQTPLTSLATGVQILERQVGGRGAEHLLPTPMTSDSQPKAPSDLERRSPQLRALASTLLPTPTAANPNDGESLESFEARRQRNLAKGINGNGQGTPLGIAVRRDWGKYEPAIRRWESITRPAPLPTAIGPRGGDRLNPAFVEWMMGLPDGWVTGVEGLTRTQQLKLLGNGVVPQQAAAAYRALLSIPKDEESAA